MLNKYSFTQQSWIDKNKELSEDFKRWSKILGVEIKNLDDLLIPADNVYCMTIHRVELPKELAKEDKDKIIATKMSACALRFVPKEMALFMASGFLSKLKTDMQAAIKEKQPYYKYILYSGHDDSILGIMSALGSPLENNPPYASHVDFELYKNNADYTVKIFYNGNPVKLIKNSDNDFCTFKEFIDAIAPYTIN